MDKLSQSKLGMVSRASFQITVIGRLPDYWEAWFGETTIREEHSPESNPTTCLTCQVRDQAELLGILNQLNNLNLPLIQVILLENSQSERRK